MHMKLYLASILIVLFQSITAQITTDKIITINPYLSFENYEHFKRLTLSSPDSRIEYLKDFDFNWGYEYKLNVKETKLDVELSDGTQFEYELNHIVSKTKMGDSSEFRLFIDPQRYYHEPDPSEQLMNRTLEVLNDSTYVYFDEVEIEVPENLRSRFEKIASGEKSGVGHFTYLDKKRIRLVRLQ